MCVCKGKILVLGWPKAHKVEIENDSSAGVHECHVSAHYNVTYT